MSSATDREPQVVGGEPASQGQFPFVVRTYAPGGTCTGSLIRDNWVLTAAHCGDDGPPTQVLIGDAESFVDGPTHVVTRLGVAEWIAHPDYNPLTLDNDIALIRLAGNASQFPPREGGAVLYVPRPLALASQPASTAAPIGAVRLVGFGDIDGSFPGITRDNPGYVFHASNLLTFAMAHCQTYYGGPLSASRQLCYGGYPGDCSGDSGGPVFTAASGNFLQLGVVSFGLDPCGSRPSVATWVPSYIAWINQEVDGTAPANPIQYGWELPPSSADGVATGVSNAQGWAFSTAGAITSIRLERNGAHFATLPCCSERGDVKQVNPAAPELSGFSAAINWGLLGNGTSNLTLVIRDSAGNERRDTRTVRGVQVLTGRPFVTGLGFTQSTFCQLFNQNGRAFAECSGLSFQQGTCNGDITFGWQNGKQAFEVVEGCH